MYVLANWWLPSWSTMRLEQLKSGGGCYHKTLINQRSKVGITLLLLYQREKALYLNYVFELEKACMQPPTGTATVYCLH